MTFIARIVPLERMPNCTSGVLLGQARLINCIEVRQIPRELLLKDGHNVAEDIGDIVVERYISSDTGMVNRV